MEGIFALLLLTGAFIVTGAVCGFIALGKIRNLERQVSDLVARLEGLTAGEAPRTAGKEKRPWTPPTAPPPETETPPPVPAKAEDTEPDPTAKGPWRGMKPLGETPPSRSASPMPKPPNPWPGKAAAWLTANWVAVAAVVSLALAGIYLVNYGIEQGIITPTLRVVLALALGAALVAGGEVLRRRGANTDLGLLAAILSSGGLITLYAAVLGALILYALIGAATALAGLVAVSLLAMALGGRYAAFLSHFGILGATLAPWLVGGETDNPFIMPAFYGAIMVVATAVGLFRGWWSLVIWGGALCIGLGLPTVLAIDGDGVMRLVYLGWLMALGLLPVLRSADAPTWAVRGLADGIGKIGVKGAGPSSLMLLSLVLFATELGIYVFVSGADAVSPALAGGGLLALSVLLAAVTARSGEARLLDLPAWPLVAVVFFILAESLFDGPEDWTLIALAGAASVLGVFYGLSKRASGDLPAFATALLPGVLFGGLEWTNPPDDRIGAFPWTYAVIAAAALMTLAAVLAGRRDADRRRAGLFVISASGLIALALSVVLTDAALTVALAATVVVAHLIDRRLSLPFVPGAVALAIGGLVTRLVIYPGLPWAWEAEWAQMALAFGSVALACALPMVRVGPPVRQYLRDVARAALGLLVPAFVALVIFRLEAPGPDWPGASHWSAVLVGLGFAFSGGSLLMRDGGAGWSGKLSRGIGAGLLGIGGLALVYGAFSRSPLFDPAERVLGPVIFNSLAVTYLLPGMLLIALAGRVGRFGLDQHGVPTAIRYLGAAFGVIWAALVLRHIWHGPDLSAPMIFDGEQYAYSALMLVTGAVTLVLVAAPRIASGFGGQTVLRRVGLAILGLTVAKVFLVDASELTGLMRVMSLLLLGLSLTALTWVDRALSRRLNPGTADGS